MKNSEKIKVVAIVGPTASGKTAVSVELAKRLGGEIISGDSMQIYKGMPIASAAPTAEEKGNIPHHLFEFLSPDTSFSVAEYVKLAGEKIKEIKERGALPIMVGGTGLYIDSLLSGVKFTEEEGSEKVREKLENEWDEMGGEVLLSRLCKIDREAAEKLHIRDKKRIIRALEMYEIHKKTPTELKVLSRAEESPYEPIYIGINYKNREILYSRIEKRVELMIRKGLLEEARISYKELGSTAVQAIGHKEFYPYFEGEISLEEAQKALIIATRHYAKRQLTWFRKNQNISWIYADECSNVFATAEKIIKENL